MSFFLLCLFLCFSFSFGTYSSVVTSDTGIYVNDTENAGVNFELNNVERLESGADNSNLIGIDLSDIKTVLVLGSGGLIGRTLVNTLKSMGIEVLEVKNRRHIDLRVPNVLDQFDGIEISYVFFLACEVGGSKFLDDSNLEVQQMIIENNLKIYQTVFPYLSRRKIPFLFTSSYLQAQPTAYGAIKRLGERWVESLNGLGHSVRLWNVYGIEPMGPRSHVITDWVTQCLTKNVVEAQTDGREARQFLYVADCASAFIRLMTSHKNLPSVVDLSSNIWTPLRDLGDIIVQASPKCEVNWKNKKAVARARLTPKLIAFHKEWKPKVDLKEGIRLYIAHCLDSGVSYDEGVKELELNPSEKEL